MTNRPGVADHAAPTPGGWLESLPIRTFLQGLGTDVAAAVAIVVYDSLQSGENIDYRWLLLTIGKTILMTGASYVMKKFRPPAGLQK